MADAEPPRSSGGMSKKVAGLPVGVWIAIGGGTLAIGYWWYKNRSTSAQVSQTAGAAATSTTDTSGMATDQYEALLAQLRDVQSEQGTEIAVSQDIDQDVDNPGPAPTPVPAAPSGVTPVGPAKPRPPTTPSKPTPAPTPKTVTVAKFPAWNSTLWGIAQRYYGSGAQYPKIYNANKSQILSQEEKHGMTAAQAQSRKWLYPGEKLTIP